MTNAVTPADSVGHRHMAFFGGCEAIEISIAIQFRIVDHSRARHDERELSVVALGD